MSNILQRYILANGIKQIQVENPCITKDFLENNPDLKYNKNVLYRTVHLADKLEKDDDCVRPTFKDIVLKYALKHANPLSGQEPVQAPGIDKGLSCNILRVNSITVEQDAQQIVGENPRSIVDPNFIQILK